MKLVCSAGEPMPAAPIILRDGYLADGGTTLINKPLFGRSDFITLRDWGRRRHAIRQLLIDSLTTKRLAAAKL
jgi:hypothetical protein